MRSYLERYDTFVKYKRDQAKELWTEFLSFGATIRQEPLYTEAQAVARVMMQRARHNIELLIPRLQQLEYHFAQPGEVWSLPTPELITVLDALEQQHGPLPIVLRAWFEIVGFVNFMGSHPKLSCYAEHRQDNLSKVHGDPLVVEIWPPYQECLDAYDRTGFVASTDDEHRQPVFYEFPFAPDIYFKALESGGGPLCLLIPNPAYDAPILDPGEQWTSTFFLQHLQTSFEWGGFPGLRNYPSAEQPRAELAFLREGLLPLI
jgi:hypothetical protein